MDEHTITTSALAVTHLLIATEDAALAAAEALRRGTDPETVADALEDGIRYGVESDNPEHVLRRAVSAALTDYIAEETNSKRGPGDRLIKAITEAADEYCMTLG